MEHRTVREYAAGDELRHLHWRATARAQRLMVREYVDPAQPRCVVLLDTRPAALSRDAFEHAVEVAASVAYAAVAHGHPTRLCTTAGLDISVEGKPDGGRVLLDALCEVEQRSGQDRAWLGELTRSLRSGGWLVLVTGDGERDLVGAVVAVRRHFAPFVIVDLGEGGTLEAPGVTVVRSSSAADAVRQWNSLVMR